MPLAGALGIGYCGAPDLLLNRIVGLLFDVGLGLRRFALDVEIRVLVEPLVVIEKAVAAVAAGS